MKKILLILSAVLSFALTSHAKLKVVATLPDLGSLAREVGGDKVDVSVLAKPTEDSHFVDARPSFVVQKFSTLPQLKACGEASSKPRNAAMRTFASSSSQK